MPIDDVDAPSKIVLYLSHDRRLEQRSPWETDAPIDQQTRQIDQRIDRIHRRLLERATAGRLTWDGDRIIRISSAKKRRSSALPTTNYKLLGKPLTGSTLQ